jgi:hypothetical protein
MALHQYQKVMEKQVATVSRKEVGSFIHLVNIHYLCQSPHFKHYYLHTSKQETVNIMKASKENS